MTAETLDMPVPAAASEFADLVERHRKIVFKVAHTYCWREADRADLVQDILAELWRAFPRYDRGRPFATWVYRIALTWRSRGCAATARTSGTPCRSRTTMRPTRPCFMVLAALAGVDVLARAPDWFASWTVYGLAGLLVTWAVYRWSRGCWPALARYMDDAATGTSLRRARAVIDEVERFEREDADPAAG